MQPTSTTTREDDDNDTEELRKFAALLTTEEGAELANVAPLPKRLLGALIEQAIPGQWRGPVYADEMRDLKEWITGASLSPELDSSDRAFAAVAAHVVDELCDECTGDYLHLARAIGAFFLTRFASSARSEASDRRLLAEQGRGGEP